MVVHFTVGYVFSTFESMEFRNSVFMNVPTLLWCMLFIASSFEKDSVYVRKTDVLA